MIPIVELYEADQENHQKKPPNADDLFPLLVLILLNANPENFFSNIEFSLFFIKLFIIFLDISTNTSDKVALSEKKAIC